MVAAVEVISPRNKDRHEAKEYYGAKYLGYLRQMVNLMLIDVLPRPEGFAFTDAIAAELNLPDQPPIPAPIAASSASSRAFPASRALSPFGGDRSRWANLYRHWSSQSVPTIR